MTKNDYIMAAAATQQRNPHWRWGQVLFNTLMDYRPEWAEEVRGTSNDPFYAEDNTHPRMVNFYNWLDARTL